MAQPDETTDRTTGAWLPSGDDRKILSLLASGATIDSVARHTQLSERTVRRRLRAMAAALGVDSTIQVVVCAVRRRVI